MPLTGATIRAALDACNAHRPTVVPLDALAAGADGALRSAPGLTAAGAAAFLATCTVESAWFTTTREFHGVQASYAPYFGRGFVQLTHRGNYAAFGAWCHDRGLVDDPALFVRSPDAAADLRWAWLSGVWYFAANGVWRWANAADLRSTSQAVNGGNRRVGTSFTPNSWTERQAAYRAYLHAGDDLLPAGRPLGASPSGPSIPPPRTAVLYATEAL